MNDAPLERQQPLNRCRPGICLWSWLRLAQFDLDLQSIGGFDETHVAIGESLSGDQEVSHPWLKKNPAGRDDAGADSGQDTKAGLVLSAAACSSASRFEFGKSFRALGISLSWALFLGSTGIAQARVADAPPSASIRADAAAQVAALNEPAARPVLAAGMHGDAVARAQVLLDRGWFSPGEINGIFSANMRRSVLAFQAAHGVKPSGNVDAATWDALAPDEAVFVAYTLTVQDATTTFTKIPAAMAERAKLPALGYETLNEAVAERFHMSQQLLARLNRGRPFKAGEAIVVAAVGERPPPAAAKARSIEIDKSQRILRVLDAQGQALAAFPISIGGPRDPLPIGRMKITNEVRNPVFTYDPVLIKSSRRGATKVDVPPGPNNPVGDMWLGLTKSHWGIHGTPDPSRIGRAETNGCIHLTNWDAHKLSALAKPGFVVDVRE